jgi:hypothetical protein
MLTSPHVAWQIIISLLSFLLVVSMVRLHSIANQCEADSEDLYDYVFGLKQSRDSLAAQNAALARLISRRNAIGNKATISKKRRNSSVVDLRECVASRILSHGRAD